MLIQKAKKLDLHQKESHDIKHWEDRYESSIVNNQDLLFHKIEKMAEAKVFVSKLRQYFRYFASSSTILEIGGGSLWASYIIKKLLPDVRILGSDIAPRAIEQHRQWASVFNTQIDGAFVSSSYDIPQASETFDLIFAFEAAHHFQEHDRTFQELNRLLKRDGVVLYFREPTSPRWIYPLMWKVVNSRRNDVLEDVLLRNEIRGLASKHHFRCEIVLSPDLLGRGPKQLAYYWTIGHAKILQRILPCTADIILLKGSPASNNGPTAVFPTETFSSL